MLDLFSPEIRRNPYALYDQLRAATPVLHVAQAGLWMIFDYEGVKRVLTDHDSFSSKRGPVQWLVFLDPPRHTKLRALIARAFTPRSIANLEPRIRQLTSRLLDQVIERGEMDLAADFSVPLPILVIAEMLGIPVSDLPQFKRWNDVILNLSYAIPGVGGSAAVVSDFAAVTIEMGGYLRGLLDHRRSTPQDDLLTRLLEAEVDGERLTEENILGFFQLLLLAGSETTTNLINNAILCLLENRDQLARLQAEPALLPSAIEEVLRYRSPVQWMIRVTTRDVEVNGQAIPAGQRVLPIMGSANRDPSQFTDPARFNITRDPNRHLAFGHGVHFCLGAALSRVESRIALTALLERLRGVELAGAEPWEPRQGLHVHGPTRLPIRFEPVPVSREV